MRTAVASSSHHCAEILRIAGLTALFDARVDGVDLDRLVLPGKPAPDMFLEAARRLNVVASACGSLRGCRSGRRSGACG